MRYKIEVGGKGEDLAYEALSYGERRVAIFIDSDLEVGGFAVVFGEGTLIDDGPKLSFGLSDETIH